MTRRYPYIVAGVASAALAAASWSPSGGGASAQAQAQQQQPRPALPMPEPPPPSQMDRIEAKLDELLRRLPTPHPPSAAASSPGGGGASGEPPSPPRESRQAEASADAGDLRPGALAVARPAPAPNALLAVPADSVGGFVFSGGPLRLDDLSGRGVRWRGQAGVELQGWLRVREAGRHQFAAEFGSPRAGTTFAVLACGVALWLEERQAGQRSGDLVLAMGRQGDALPLALGAELSPGLYRFRMWVACGRAGGPGGQPLPVTAEVLLKSPSEMNLRALSPADVLHREG